MIFPSASAKAPAWRSNIDPSRFGIVNADARPDVWLEASERESPDEIPHERTGVNKRSRTGVSHLSAIHQCQSGVSATPEAVTLIVQAHTWVLIRVRGIQ